MDRGGRILQNVQVPHTSRSNAARSLHKYVGVAGRFVLTDLLSDWPQFEKIFSLQ